MISWTQICTSPFTWKCEYGHIVQIYYRFQWQYVAMPNEGQAQCFATLGEARFNVINNGKKSYIKRDWP